MPRRETDQFHVHFFFRDDIDGSQNPESESVESVKTTKNAIVMFKGGGSNGAFVTSMQCPLQNGICIIISLS